MNNKIIDDCKIDIIVYHEFCSDGIASAWISQRNNRESKLVPCKAGENPKIEEKCLDKKNIIFVDICPSVNYIKSISSIVNKMIILDHHISNFRDVENMENKPNNLYTIFDMKKSGSMITWEFFNKDIETPWFINYISDRDLWQWKLPNSKNINVALFEEKYITFEGLTSLYEKYKTESEIKIFLEKLNESGFQINKLRDELVEKETKKSIHCTFKFDENIYNVWLNNGPENLRSDIGNSLMKKNFQNGMKPDFAVFWRYDLKSHEFWLSMRGENWSPDLSIICKKYNGGGHAKASGCSLPGGIELRSIFVPI